MKAIILAGGLTVISAAAYLVEWLRHMAGFEDMQQGADN